MQDTIDTHALVVSGPQPVGLVREPQTILDDASRAAKALMQVVSGKKDKLMFNGRQYLAVDDWQVVGTFHGCTADIEWTRPIEVGDARGWEARAVLMDRTGRILSHAETMCLDDEDHWSDRPKYAYCYVLKSGGHSEEDPGPDEIVWEPNPFKPGKVRPMKERMQVGVEKVPSFQLRSMAQTRAISKVHSNVFRWVSQLAGYAGTPAEELPVEVHRTDEEQDDTSGQQQPQETKPAKTTKAAKPAAAKPSASADDAVYIADIKALTYKGKNDKGDTVDKPMWKITFANGKDGMAFDDATALLAEKAHVEKLAVKVTLEESTKRPGSFKVAELSLA